MPKSDVTNDPQRAIRAVPWSVEDWMDFHDSLEAFKRRFVERRQPRGLFAMRRLSETQAGAVEDEMRRMEADPSVDKHALRLFMQSAMPCGHAVGNLLTCPTPPYGCVLCGQMDERGRFQVPTREQAQSVAAVVPVGWNGTEGPRA